MLRLIKEDQKGFDVHRIVAPHATVRRGNYPLRRGEQRSRRDERAGHHDMLGGRPPDPDASCAREE
jgi:hypothetical protein